MIRVKFNTFLDSFRQDLFPHFSFKIALVFASLVSIVQARADGLVDDYMQKRANAFLTVISYSLTPDVTTGSLSLSEGVTNNPSLSMTSLGGGGILSDDFPLYFEGTMALNRYNPTFITNSSTPVTIPVRWNSISGTGGLGWDFKLNDQFKIRPIANVTLGHVESDLSIASRYLNQKTGYSLDFLENGRLNAFGVGGSLMLIYQDFHPEYENEVEIRYTNIQLSSFNSSRSVEGTADSQSLGLWSRRRVPTGLTVLDNTVRSVVEFAHTQYLGESRGALGFDYLSSVGAGVEIDLKNYGIIVQRARLMLRYQFAPDVYGYNVGIAVSF
jgi:hypothetical protein